MKTTSNKINNVLDVIHEKCPKCRQGHVFKQNVSFMQLPIMNDRCEKCNYKYDREPGYFIGAMYISYGLAILQGIITFLILQYTFPALSTIWKTIFVILVICVFGRKNYKLSRVIYIHIFPW